MTVCVKHGNRQPDFLCQTYGNDAVIKYRHNGLPDLTPVLYSFLTNSGILQCFPFLLRGWNIAWIIQLVVMRKVSRLTEIRFLLCRKQLTEPDCSCYLGPLVSKRQNVGQKGWVGGCPHTAFFYNVYRETK